MSLELLSPAAFLAGLAGLAGALFLLQRLRVRPREQTVITTLFWREAVRETRARALVRRFRHPWAYALVLLVAGLLWLGTAGPRLAGGAERDWILVLDGSAGMARVGRFEAAAAALQERAAELPRARTRVLWSGAGTRALLLPGEDPLLLERRLAGRAPEPAPAAVEDLLRELAAGAVPGRAASVVVFGDAPLRAPVLEGLPDGWRVTRAPLDLPAAAENRGITALGLADAASGAWDRVDVLVELRGPASEGAALELSLGGEPLALEGRRETVEPGRCEVLFPGVPAAGGVLRARLADADGLSLDDAAAAALPDRPPIGVALSPSLAARLGPVLAADPAARPDATAPSVAVRRAGEDVGEGLPALELVPLDEQEEALLLTHPPGEDPGQALLEAFDALGLDELDGPGLARETGRTVRVAAREGEARGISAWELLFDAESSLAASRAFPLLVARSLRWLADAEAPRPYALAGEPLAAGGPHADALGRALDPVGAPFTPPTAGEYRDPAGAALFASLADPAATAGPTPAVPAGEEPPAEEPAGDGDPLTWILLGVLALLLLEWYLFSTGRMP